MTEEVLPIPGIDQIARLEARIAELEAKVEHMFAGLAHLLPSMKD